MASISIVLKAVDQYSGTLTGLNQGFELVGKAMSGLKAVADVAFTAIKAGSDLVVSGIQKSVELATKGGTYSEMSRQFGIIADNFGRNGGQILDSLDKITLNMIGMTDAVKLAGKGVAAGFNEKELEDIFTFVKRRTELTGEDFNQMSETIINSMAKGRFTTLKEFGLIIEKGDTTSDVFEKIKNATKAFGDAGYNTADSITALNNQQDKFLTKIGAAINASPAWQKVFITITDLVVGFVKSLDTTPITRFFDVIITTAEEVVKVLDTMGISKWLRNTLSEVDAWVSNIGKSIATALRFVQTAVSFFAEFQRENPLLSSATFGVGKGVGADFFNPEALAQTEVGLNKIIKTLEGGSAPAKSFTEKVDLLTDAEKRLQEATEAAMNARRNGTDTAEVDQQLTLAQEELQRIKNLQSTQSQGSAQDLIKNAGLDELNSELDGLLQKANAPIPKQQGLESAVKTATSPTGVEAVTAGLNSQSVLLSLGNWLLSHIVDRASTERTPLAVLATP